MTRAQAFWLLVVAAVVAVLSRSLRAPSDRFWESPPRLVVDERTAVDLVARAVGIETDVPGPQAETSHEPVEEAVPDAVPPPKEEKTEDAPKPKPKPKKKAPAPAKQEPAKPESAAPQPVVSIVDREAVKAMVDAALPDIYDCYDYFMRHADMNVDGEVVVAIDVGVSGSVTGVLFRTDPLRIPRMEECVSKQLAGRRLDPPPSEPVTVRYPLVFSKPGTPNYDMYAKRYGRSP